MYLETLDDVEQNADGSLDIEAAAARVEAPWLIVHGDADEAVSVAEAIELAGRASKGRGRAESLIVPGAGHTFGAVEPFGGMTPALEQAFDATVGFMSRVLG